MDWQPISMGFSAQISLNDGESQIIPVTSNRRIHIAIFPGGNAATVEHTLDADFQSAQWVDSGFGQITEEKTIFTQTNLTAIRVSASGGSVGFSFLLWG